MCTRGSSGKHGEFADRFGPVKRVDVIRGRGFGFVKFAADADAKAAVQAVPDTGAEDDRV